MIGEYAKIALEKLEQERAVNNEKYVFWGWDIDEVFWIKKGE